MLQTKSIKMAPLRHSQSNQVKRRLEVNSAQPLVVFSETLHNTLAQATGAYCTPKALRVQ